MTEIEAGSRPGSAALPDLVARPSNLTGRRALFAGLVIATIAAVVWLSPLALSPHRPGLLGIVLPALFLLPPPRARIGFSRAAIGLLILPLPTNPLPAA